MLLWLLQEEILRERSKHQRYANKKNEELRALVQEVSISASSHPHLHVVIHAPYTNVHVHVHVLHAFFQLEELRSSERTLRSRVKNLTNELSVMKKGYGLSPLCLPLGQ